MNRRKIVRGLIYFLVLAVLVNSAIFLTSNAKENVDAFRQFNWTYLPAILALVLVNFLLREVKWDFFRRKAGIDVPRKSSWLIFFSGYSMCISPGRLGELIKPALYKEYHNAPLKKAVPLVFCERLTDLLGMVIMCLATIWLYIADYKAANSAASTAAAGQASAWTLDRVYLLFGASMAILAALIGMARWRTFVHGVLDKLSSVGKLAKPADKLRHLYNETYPLLTFFNLAAMSFFAAFSWFFECLAMWVVCHGLGISDTIHLYHCVFIFCISSILGALAIIFPGGMGPVEILMRELIRALGVSVGKANAAMFLTRFCTLIFGAALGFAILAITARVHSDAAVLDHVAEAAEAMDEPAGEPEPETT